MKLYPLFPMRSLYVIAIGFSMICLLAFVWYIYYQIYAYVSAADIIHLAGTNSTESDTVTYVLDNIMNYILIFGLICVGLWMWVYSQKKGVYVSEE